MSDDFEMVRGSGNVFRDFDMPNPDLEQLRAILAAPVDLLYFGGIGTYVKASSESQADAGDRASDAIRVDAITMEAGERGIPAAIAACGARQVSCEPVAADLESAFLALTSVVPA